MEDSCRKQNRKVPLQVILPGFLKELNRNRNEYLVKFKYPNELLSLLLSSFYLDNVCDISRRNASELGLRV